MIMMMRITRFGKCGTDIARSWKLLRRWLYFGIYVLKIATWLLGVIDIYLLLDHKYIIAYATTYTKTMDYISKVPSSLSSWVNICQYRYTSLRSNTDYSLNVSNLSNSSSTNHLRPPTTHAVARRQPPYFDTRTSNITEVECSRPGTFV